MKRSKQRRSIRLPGYDYTQDGVYFVTVCTHKRRNIFGEILEEDMLLNTLGCIVDEEWHRTAVLRPYVELDSHVIMPNHLHGIIVINHGEETDRTQHAASLPPSHGMTPHNVQSQSLSGIIRAFKAATTRRINMVRETPGTQIWQGRFYEHIIRNEQALNEIRQYIVFNPMRWAYDHDNPDSVS